MVLNDKQEQQLQSILAARDRGTARRQFHDALAEASEGTRPAWTPFELADSFDPSDALFPQLPEGVQVYVNSRYQVNVYHYHYSGFGRVVRLSIKSHENDTRHDWRDFQRIKNELVGLEVEGIELYPKESRLVDTCNQYNLYCLLDINYIPLGYKERIVSESVEGNSCQRKWEADLRPTDLEDASA